MRTFPVLVLTAILLAGCDSDSSPTAPELEVVTVLKASTSGYPSSVRATVGQPDWPRTWQTLHAGQSPLPALPAVDFNREMVVLAAAGTRANGCFAIEIVAASGRPNGAIRFDVLETTPGPTCVCTQAETQPVHVVKVLRGSGAVSFVERRVERAC